MFLKLSLPIAPSKKSKVRFLSFMGRSNSSEEWATDRDIQTSLRSLGFSLTPKVLGDRTETQYMLEEIDPVGETVDMNSTAHYRDLAAKNLCSDPDVSFSGEMRKYTIFFGATGETRTLVIVTRVSEGEIALLFKNESIKRALETLEEYLPRILALPFIDREKAFNRSVEFHTVSKKKHALTGYLTEKTLRRSFRINNVETSLMILSLLLFMVAFTFDRGIPMPENPTGKLVDPLDPTIRKLVGVWPFALVAAATNLLTILVKHYRASREQITWSR